ncbi:MAG TPA: DUF4124 domain-containing protein [Usitatibacter sp.]|nr:DUF4124 domain-containing protein [Usitatibacter sp.]
MPSGVRTAALAALLVVACAPLAAQVLYKWTDSQGKIQYSDQPPKKNDGPVTRIEPDIAPTPTPPRKSKAPAPAAPAKAASVPDDTAAKRRASRNALEKRLLQARDRVESARKALADAAEPGPDDRQVVQQQVKAGQGGMHGLSSARSNCRQVKDAAGKVGLVCPTMIPKEEYLDRVAKLEEDVRVAESELAEAEQAWRRGVD